MPAARRPHRRTSPAALAGLLRPRLAAERGQVLFTSVLMMFVVLGAVGLVVDVGSWYHQQRVEQAAADAAALAGAQALPDDPGEAVQLAVQYAKDNGGGLTAGDVAISTDRSTNDTISVRVTRSAPTYFAQLFGLHSVTVRSTAAARSDGISAADYVAPIAVSSEHPMLQCTPSPCSDPTELDMIDLKQQGSSDAAGNFSLLDLRIGAGGVVGDSTLADWMEHGYDQSMPLGVYTSVTGSKFNGNSFAQALRDRYGSEVLFPVYKPPILKSGSNAEFNIIGWVGFSITGSAGGGNSGKVYGSFTHFIAHGLQASDPGSQADFGVRAIQLVR